MVKDSISNEFSLAQQQAGAELKHVYQKIAPSNVVAQLFPLNEELKQWSHYPRDDVMDFAHHTQYYYHSHPAQDDDRVPEHGHFHVFLRRPRFGKDETPVFCSEEYQQSHGEKDNLVHVFAIAMNEYGFPKALFTVNHWMVLGAWYDAARIIRELDTFKVEIANSPFVLVNKWITNMVILFKPYISELLHHRDEVITEFARSNPDQNVYVNKSLEVLSVMRLQAS